jgi:hypothetical protein
MGLDLLAIVAPRWTRGAFLLRGRPEDEELA